MIDLLKKLQENLDNIKSEQYGKLVNLRVYRYSELIIRNFMYTSIH